MKSIYHFCRGESHKKTHKPCQDYAYADSSDALSMAIVCDGHGGDRYFRSDRGSRFLVEITEKAIRSFVADMETATSTPVGKSSVFDNAPFTSYSKDASDGVTNQPAHKALMWLFSSIICQWNERIEYDADNYDLTDWELAHVPEQYIDEFRAKRSDRDRTEGFEKTYGCTLMAYVQTPKYWFAFHIGDGKCVSLHKNNGKIEWRQPIPWDERCFLNKTTSICDSNALEEFRYCYQGNGSFPKAVFLGSDGMDDTYGDGEKLANFYMKMYQELAKSGVEAVKKMLEEDLPVISQRGSKDDMSIACVYDDIHAKKNSSRIAKHQIDLIKDELAETKKQIMSLEKKIEDMESMEVLSDSQRIDLDYARKSYEKAMRCKGSLEEKCSVSKDKKQPEFSRRFASHRFIRRKK